MRRIRVDDKRRLTRPDLFHCQQCLHLLEGFADAVDEVITLNERNHQAVSEDDPDSHRFDRLIDLANERKQNAKSAYVRHIETHAASA
jgi:hypothetical protein